jgi:ATP-dependent Lon protease
VKQGLEIIPVSTIDEVLARALTGALTPIEWNESDEPIAATAKVDDLDSDAVVTH